MVPLQLFGWPGLFCAPRFGPPPASPPSSSKPNHLVWLFGSRARGDWDGHSDTDLLVVADSQEVADGLADALLDASCGADVIALSRASWDAMATSESPHWRSIHQQARQLLSFRP